jgi:uncharacterized protein YebE (UPF0316 family)
MFSFFNDLKSGYPELFEWVIFPLIIFCSRLCDVSLGTLRSVLASKGNKKVVPFIGFFEVLMWLIAISQIMKNLNNINCYLAWALGFAAGSFVGLSIEEKLALGKQIMRIISVQSPDQLLMILKERNIGYTVIDGSGARGPVKLIFTVVERKEVKEMARLLKEYLPNSFYSVEDVKDSSDVKFGVEKKKINFYALLLPLKK